MSRFGVLHGVSLGLSLAVTVGPVGVRAQSEAERSPVPDWRTDTAVALRTAEAEHRVLLLHFAGTDWSEGCQRLIENVFEEPGFAAVREHGLVLVRVDFPRDPVGQSDAVRDANVALQERYRATRYPSVYLADPQGRAFAQFGTRAFLGPETFLEHVEEKLPILTRRDAAWRRAATGSDGPTDGALLAEGLDAVDPALWRHYRPELERLLALEGTEPQPAFDRFRRALAGLEAEDAVPGVMQEVQRLFGQGRVGDAIARLDRFHDAHRDVLASGLRQTLLFSKAGLTARVGDFEAAVRTLDEAVAVDPDSALAEQVRTLRTRLAANLPPPGEKK